MAGEVATAWVTLLPSAKGFGANLSKQIDGDLTTAGTTGGKKFGGAFGSSLKGIGGGIIAALGIHQIIGGLSGLVSGASDFNETLSKSRVIFGENAAAIEAWSKQSATNLGLPQQAALDLAANFGNMFQQLGFSGEQALTMSQGVAQLSADLGSFNNLPTSDVADRISAAFRGEYDSLQLLIPNINAARVQTEALAMTGKTNAAQLTAQEKAAAVLAIVNRDGAAALGDFARTSDGAANKSKILQARWEDLKSKAGQKLLPLFNGLLDFGGKILDFFSGAGDSASKFGGALSGVGKIVGTVIGWFGDFIADNKATFLAWWATLQTIFTGLRDLVMAIVARIVEFWEDHGTRIMATVSAVWDRVKAIIGAALAIVQGIIQTFIAIFKGDWSGAWENILKVLKKAWELIANVIGLAWELIKGIIMTAISAVWDWISGKFGDLVEWVTGLPGRLATAAGDLFGWLITKAGEIGARVITAVVDFFTWIGNLPTMLAEKAGDIWLWIMTKAGQINARVIAALWQFWEWLKTLPSVLAEKAGDVFGWFVDAAQAAAEAAWDWLTGASEPREIPQDWLDDLPGGGGRVGGQSAPSSPPWSPDGERSSTGSSGYDGPPMQVLQYFGPGQPESVGIDSAHRLAGLVGIF